MEERRMRAQGLAAAVVAAGLGWAGQAQAATTRTVTYSSTGAEQSFVVAPGMTSVQVAAVGAHGDYGYATTAGTSFGAGAKVTGTLSVTPGQTLFVEVGTV